jgi:hypothetical protein
LSLRKQCRHGYRLVRTIAVPGRGEQTSKVDTNCQTLTGRSCVLWKDEPGPSRGSTLRPYGQTAAGDAPAPMSNTPPNQQTATYLARLIHQRRASRYLETFLIGALGRWCCAGVPLLEFGSPNQRSPKPAARERRQGEGRLFGALRGRG